VKGGRRKRPLFLNVVHFPLVGYYESLVKTTKKRKRGLWGGRRRSTKRPSIQESPRRRRRRRYRRRGWRRRRSSWWPPQPPSSPSLPLSSSPLSSSPLSPSSWWWPSVSKSQQHSLRTCQIGPRRGRRKKTPTLFFLLII